MKKLIPITIFCALVNFICFSQGTQNSSEKLEINGLIKSNASVDEINSASLEIVPNIAWFKANGLQYLGEPADLNDATESGIYGFSESTANSPFIAQGHVVVYNYYSPYGEYPIFQYAYGRGRIFSRASSASNTWSTWSEIGADSGGGGSPNWGDIEGTLSDQTDLQAAFDALPIPGVVEITEEGNTGYGTTYRRDNPDYFGPIGDYAFDLSHNEFLTSEVYGATGDESIALGWRSTASGSRSISIGSNINEASGNNSSTIGGQANKASGLNSGIFGGYGNEASGTNSFIFSGKDNISTGYYGIVLGGISNFSRSSYEISLGLYSTDYTPESTGSLEPTDRLFNIGNGLDLSNRSDAITILKNAQTGIDIDNFEANTTGSKLQVNGSIENIETGGALILKSPDGSRWQIKVDNSGAIKATKL